MLQTLESRVYQISWDPKGSGTQRSDDLEVLAFNCSDMVPTGSGFTVSRARWPKGPRRPRVIKIMLISGNWFRITILKRFQGNCQKHRWGEGITNTLMVSGPCLKTKNTLANPLTHSLTHSLIHSLTHLFTRPITH